MAKQASIKEIAKMAGVSPGTVDRVLHNRGNISEKRRIAVEKALEEVGYKPNIHTSAVSFRKAVSIAITSPFAYPGGYWESVFKGFNEALQEFADINISCIYHCYDQFDAESCRDAFQAILEDENLDAVIIGPTFEDLTQDLCSRLDEKELPYVFVDSSIKGTEPWAVFASDQHVCGELVGRLLDAQDGGIAILSTRRRGSKRANNSIMREQGLLDFLKRNGIQTEPKRSQFSMTDLDLASAEIKEFFSKNPEIHWVTVLNSSGYIVADALKALGKQDVRIVGFDFTFNNRRCLEEGTIHSLICQRPVDLGYYAIHYLVEHFIYKVGKNTKTTLIPVDVVFKESLSCYRESSRYKEVSI